MGVTEELVARRAEAPPKPDDIEPEEKTLMLFRRGYLLGWHHGIEDAIEIAQEVEEEEVDD